MWCNTYDNYNSLACRKKKFCSFIRIDINPFNTVDTSLLSKLTTVVVYVFSLYKTVITIILGKVIGCQSRFSNVILGVRT